MKWKAGHASVSLTTALAHFSHGKQAAQFLVALSALNNSGLRSCIRLSSSMQDASDCQVTERTVCRVSCSGHSDT
jgi:hypothetical protein